MVMISLQYGHLFIEAFLVKDYHYFFRLRVAALGGLVILPRNMDE